MRINDFVVKFRFSAPLYLFDLFFSKTCSLYSVSRVIFPAFLMMLLHFRAERKNTIFRRRRRKSLHVFQPERGQTRDGLRGPIALVERPFFRVRFLYTRINRLKKKTATRCAFRSFRRPMPSRKEPRERKRGALLALFRLYIW